MMRSGAARESSGIENVLNNVEQNGSGGRGDKEATRRQSVAANGMCRGETTHWRRLLAPTSSVSDKNVGNTASSRQFKILQTLQRFNVNTGE